MAEILRPLVGYSRDLGLPVRWLVLDAPGGYFTITKRIDNGISGVPGDGGGLWLDEHTMFQDVAASLAQALRRLIAPGDLVFFHDPQTAGLVPHARQAGAVAIWRAHNGADGPNEHTRAAWEFLRAYLADAHGFVFTLQHFAPLWVKRRPLMVIPPFIDPVAPKNQPMSSEVATAILASCGLLAHQPQAAPTFTRFDGTFGRPSLQPLIVRDDRGPDPATPMVVQVSRWDAVKDMTGVLRGFAGHVAPYTDAALTLLGPEVRGVVDDPEAERVFAECVQAWRELDPVHRRRTQLVCLPMSDPEANAAVVNALQRHATVIVQKSWSEGFGLTATEAMWKAKPLVTSRVGGLRLQVPDSSLGTALPDPGDLAAFGAAVTSYLTRPQLREMVGARAREHVSTSFPTPTSWLSWPCSPP